MPRTFALARSLAFVFFVSAMLPASVRGQDISLAKTVGTVPATCAATTSIAVPVGTTVYYCYRVTNSGSTVFNFHDLVDSDLGTLLTDHPEVLGAGASVEFIQSAVPAATVTNTATWTAKTALGSYAYDDTVPFSYVSINGSGAPLGLADDGEANIVSPFPITFYGVTSTDLRIGNNGGILFNATSGDVGFANQALPSAAHPLAILPFWDDMGAGGNVYWEVQGAAPNRTLIVEWYEKPHYSNVGASTFEVIFHEGSSDIVFQYQDVDFGNASYDGGASATIGLNQDGTTALQYSFNTASVSAGKAIRFHQVVPTSQTATASATVTVQAPDIDVSPASLAGTQATNTTTTQTLTLANNGTAGLNWTIDEENLPRFPIIPAAPLVAQPAAETVDAQAPAAAPAAVPGGGKTWLAPAAVLYDNGAFVTHPGGGAGGADLSMLDTSLGGSAYGFGHAVSSGFRIADDFTVPAGGWTISQITFFAYQTGSTTTSTMDALNLRIWDGVPGAAGSNIVFGDTTTNRMTATAFSGAYRATDTDMTNGQRPIMATTAAVGTYLPAGTYWVDWQTGGTLPSGPWSIPVTIAGQTQKPGSNAVQWDPSASTWNPVMDTANNTQQDQAFVIEGTAGAPACFTPVDATWLSVSPASGLTAAGNSAPVTVTFDSTGLALGTYTANLCVNSDDPDAGPGNGTDLVVVPVSLTVTAPVTHTVTSSVGTPAGTIAPLGVQTVTAGSTATFTLTPNAGHHIDNVGGTCGGTLTGTSYTTNAISADCTVIANFAVTPPTTHTVTSSVGTPAGTIAPLGVQTVTAGSTATFTLTPNAGHHIDNVGGTCGGTLTGTSYTTNAISADCTVIANFAVDLIPVTTVVPAGHGAVSGPATVPYGGSASYTLTPDPGYGIGSVTGCGGTLSGNVYTVPSVTAACTITASFVRLGGPPPALVPVNGWQMLLLMMGLLLGGAFIALRRGG